VMAPVRAAPSCALTANENNALIAAPPG
jgi:hypothetical protein